MAEPLTITRGTVATRPGTMVVTQIEMPASSTAAERNTGLMPPRATMPAEVNGPAAKPRETAAAESP